MIRSEPMVAFFATAEHTKPMLFWLVSPCDGAPMLKPHDVFTPAKPPLEVNNVYAPRGQHEKDFVQALERSHVPVVFGEYGVGKTSMARHVLLDTDQAGRLVNIESAAGKSLADLFKVILEHLGYEVTKSLSQQDNNSSTLAGSAEAGAVFPGLTAKFTTSGSTSTARTTTSVRELAVASPTDSKILDLCEEAGLVLLVDEVHRADAGMVRDLSSFIKAASNKPCKNFKVVLLGTASDATRLVDHDPGIDRIIQEISLPSLSTAEATSIVLDGMARLAIEISDGIVGRVVKLAVGSPALVQYLALEIAEAAFPRDPRKASDSDLPQALKNYIRKRANRMDDAYLKAIETTGQRRYRKQILIAMGNIDAEYITMDQLVTQVSKQLGESVPSTALSGPLRSLKTPEFGSILRDVERHEGGSRVFNYTAFSDPAMRAFIRMRYVGEEEGLLQAGEGT